MGDGFSERLRVAANNAGGVGELGRKSGVASRTISGYLAGKGDPSRERLVALAEAGDVSVDWLATGRGPIRSFDEALGELEQGAVEAGARIQEAATRYRGAGEAGGFVYVPRYDIEASAGGGAEVRSEQVVDYLAFRGDWIRAQGLDPQHLALIEALGDSMAPTIEDRDLVLVNLGRREVGRPGVYVLRRDHTLLAKRLEVRWDAAGVIVRSDNPAYDDQVLDEREAANLEILGRVMWLARRL